MSYEQKRKDIQAFFIDNITIIDEEKIAWDNVGFTIPQDASTWIRFSIQNVDSNFASIGPSKIARRTGIVFIQVFSPKDSTTEESEFIVDEVVTIFENNLLSEVNFRSPSVKEIGVNSGWYQINISVPFFYDILTTIN